MWRDAEREDGMWSDAERATDIFKRSCRPLLSFFLPFPSSRNNLEPHGVVWCGGVHIVCSTEAQWN